MMGGLASAGYNPMGETSREAQVKALLDTAKEHGIEITKETFDFIVRRVYGDGSDAFSSLSAALTGALLSAKTEKKED